MLFTLFGISSRGGGGVAGSQGFGTHPAYAVFDLGSSKITLKFSKLSFLIF